MNIDDDNNYSYIICPVDKCLDCPYFLRLDLCGYAYACHMHGEV